MRHALTGSAVLLMTTLASSSANAEQPAWCQGDKLKGARNGRLSDAKDTDPTTALPAIAKCVCVPDEAATKAAAEIEALRADWSKKLGMSDEDWRDVVEVAATKANLGRDYSSFSEKDAFPDGDVAFSALTPFQQWYSILKGYNELEGYTYLADALGPKLSELGKLAYSIQCSRSKDWAVELAMCEPDTNGIDRAKLAQEISGLKTSAAHKLTLRFAANDFFENRLPPLQEMIKKWKGKDPAYAKMFEIAAKTRGDWDQLWKSESKLLDLTLAMDDARETKSRKLHEGCSTSTWAAFREAVGKIPAARFENPLDSDLDIAAKGPVVPEQVIVAFSPQTYLATVAFVSCEKGADADSTVVQLGRGLMGRPGYRGPRLATWQAIVDAGLQLDKADAKVDLGQPQLRSIFEMNSQGGWNFSTVGKVGKPDAKGNVVVTYAKKTVKQETCLSAEGSNRIAYWQPGGTPVYYYKCLKWGTVVIDKTPDPQTVKQRYIEKLAPGTTGWLASDGVWMVFANAKKNPVAVFGVPVK